MNFPDLSEPYASALREAVAFVEQTFSPTGIVATGTIVRGEADPNSDIDLYVVNSEHKRQKLSRIFNGVPVEIFVNPPAAIRRYFTDEAEDGKPFTSHMLATGVVLLGEDNQEIQDLLAEAARVLRKGPSLSEEMLIRERYAVATLFEDAEDIRGKDKNNSLLLLNSCVSRALNFVFHSRGVWLPRDKKVLQELEDIDPKMGALFRSYFEASEFLEKFTIAHRIVLSTADADKFFEWETEEEGVNP